MEVPSPRYFTGVTLLAQRGKDDESVNYSSRGTSDPDAASQFHHGSTDRKERLHNALEDIGVDPSDLIDLPEFRGSAALRTYSSFILPKSEGALAMAEQPQRATVVANNISFLMREHRSHQQEWLRNHDRSLKEAEDQLSGLQNPITLVLDDVRSAHNVGSILRFAEAARCEKVLLCGSMTPVPPNPKVLKTAVGAAEYVPYESAGSTLQAVRDLKKQGVKVFGVETTSKSVTLWKMPFFANGEKSNQEQSLSPQVAFVFGNELVGVGVDVLGECDGGIIALPTHGIKNSLNIATCASVVTWEALRQWELYKESGIQAE